MSWIAVGGAVVGLAGAGISAYGQYQQGQAEKRAQEANARVAMQEGIMIQASGQRESDIIKQNQILNEMRQRKQLDKDVGSMTAAYSGRGVSVNTGSPLDAIADSISNAELDIAIGNWNSKVESDTALWNAKMGYQNRMNASSLMRQYGRNAATNAMFAAGGTLLQGVGSAAGKIGSAKFGSSKIGEGLESPAKALYA